jgi:hypothetical protein
LNGGKCLPCPPECKKCKGAENCTEYQDGYYLNGEKFDPCEPEYKKCDGPDSCTECKKGFYLYQRKCVPRWNI